MTSQEIMEKAVQVLDSKKGEDIKVLDVSGLTSLGDYFVIASGGSNIQVKALAEEVENQLSAMGVEPKRVEGHQSAMWILLDYYDVIIHVFYKETRDFYCLERLWADAPEVDLSKFTD